MNIHLDSKALKKKANNIRDEVIEIAISNKAGHIAPSLSCVEILVALYYHSMSLYGPEDHQWEERDRLVFSKGHGCYALYAILADKGLLPKEEWRHFYTDKSSLFGCMERRPDYGLEAGCGSLGHGLPMAVGIAFGAKLQNKKYRTFCIIGDGEMQEGTTWEALQFALKHELNNLTVIIDANRLQAMDFITNILNREIKDDISRLRGFGLSPIVCPGHNIDRLVNSIAAAQALPDNKPKVVFAETIKGFGLKCMENVPKFHFRIPTEEELSMGRSYERDE